MESAQTTVGRKRMDSRNAKFQGWTRHPIDHIPEFYILGAFLDPSIAFSVTFSSNARAHRAGAKEKNQSWNVFPIGVEGERKKNRTVTIL